MDSCTEDDYGFDSRDRVESMNEGVQDIQTERLAVAAAVQWRTIEWRDDWRDSQPIDIFCPSNE